MTSTHRMLPGGPGATPGLSTTPVRSGPHGTRYGVSAAEAEAAETRAASKGFRHRAVYDAAYAVGQLHGGGEVTDNGLEHYRRVLTAIGTDGLGLSSGEVARAIRNGLARGAERPRTATGGGLTLVGRADTLEAIARWWEEAQADARYRDRRGGTTLRILAAFALLAARAGSTDLSDSYRQVAEVAGVAVGTITKHRDRLAPWVTPRNLGSRWTGERTTWRLNVSHRASGNTPATPGGGAYGLFPNAHDPLSCPDHDRWYRWANGWRLYSLVAGSPDGVTVEELVAATGLHRSTVARALSRFRSWGVVSSDGAGRWTRLEGVTVPPERWWTQRRQERHACERELYRSWRDHRREERRRRPPRPTNRRTHAPVLEELSA